MENLEKLLRAVDAQLGGVPEWKRLIQAAERELKALKDRVMAVRD